MRSSIPVLFAAVVLLLGGGTATVDSPRQAFAKFTGDLDEQGDGITLKVIRDRHGDVVGWGSQICTSLDNGFDQCQGTLVLPKGRISVSGVRRSGDYYVFSVVGGTGFYLGAGGTLLVNLVEQGKERLFFSLLLPLLPTKGA